MPDLKSPTPATESVEKKWFLKTNNDSVFGPVERDTLKAWAQQGRIAPDNQVSTDKKSWKKAKSVPFLEMRWIAQLPGGTEYGPLNINALKELVRDGTVPVSAIIKNINSNEIVRLEEKTGVSTNISPAPKKKADKTEPGAKHTNHEPEPEKKTQKKRPKSRTKSDRFCINCDQKKKNTSQDEQRLKQEIKITKQELSKLRDTFSRSKSAMEKKEREVKEAYENLKQLEKKHNSVLEQKRKSEKQLKGQIEKTRKQAEELETSNLKYREKLAQKEKQLRLGEEKYSWLQEQTAMKEQTLKAEIEQLKEKLESSSHSCHEALDAQIGALREKAETASAAREDTMRLLSEKQHEYEDLKARAEQEKREMSARLEEFKQLLVEESENARQELEGDRSIFDIVSASCEQKEHNYNHRMERLEKLIRNDKREQNVSSLKTSQLNSKQNQECRICRNIAENPPVEESASPDSQNRSAWNNGKLTRLKSLETEIQRELEHWRENNREKPPERKFPPKAIFRAKPWMKLK